MQAMEYVRRKRHEARVRREVAMRKHNHEKMNAERKLTDEQRREKVDNKKVEEERKGLVGAVFKYVHGDFLAEAIGANNALLY